MKFYGATSGFNRHFDIIVNERAKKASGSQFQNHIKIYENYFCFRRKTGRNSTHNKHGPSSTDTSVGFENDHRHTAKTYSPSTATKPPLSNSSSYYKQSNYSSNTSSPSFGQDIPPALPPRKPVDKKNSVQLASTSSVFNDSLSQAPSSTYDDTTSNLLAPTRILPSKEVKIKRSSRDVVTFILRTSV